MTRHIVSLSKLCNLVTKVKKSYRCNPCKIYDIKQKIKISKYIKYIKYIKIYQISKYQNIKIDHNFAHAVDAAQAIYALIKSSPSIENNLNDLDK